MKVFPVLFYLTLFSLGFRGINIFGVKIADIILLLAGFSLICERRNLRINPRIIIMFLILYFFVLVSIFRAENFYFSVRDVFRYPLAIVMFLIVTNFVDSREKFGKVLLCTVIIGAVCSVINLGVFRLWSKGVVFSSLLHTATKGVEGRVEAFFYDPNHYASFLTIPGLFSILYPLHHLGRKKFKKTIFWLVIPLLILGGIIVTGSRSGVVSFIIGVVAIVTIGVLYLFKRISRKDMLLTIILVIFLIGCVVALSYLIEKFIYSHDTYMQLISFRKFRSGSIQRGIFKRSQLWQGCFYTFLENPVFGIGASNFINVYPDIATRYGLGHSRGQFPHNSYLGMLAEVGLVAFIFEMLILIYVFSLALRCLRIGYDYNLSIILISVFLSVIVNMFFLDMFYARQVWLLFGLIASYYEQSVINFEKKS